MEDRSGYWTGTLAAPLPVVAITVAVLALSVGLSETLAIFIILAYAAVLFPLAVVHGLLRFTGSHRWLPYAVTMFVVSFLITLGGWQFLEVGPDSSVSVEFDDGVEQPVPLPMVGVIAAFLVGVVQVICVTIFWRLAIRPRFATRYSF